MDERMEEIVNKYDMKVYSMTRARGAFVLECDQGIRLLKIWENSEKKADYVNKITTFLRSQGIDKVDVMTPNMDGHWVTANSRGDAYVLKEWYYGSECSVRAKEDLLRAGRNLGRIHNRFYIPYDYFVENQQESAEAFETAECARVEIAAPEYLPPAVESWCDTLRRHNREMKRVHNFIRTKKQKNSFEVRIIKAFDEFYQRAEAGLNRLEVNDFDRLTAEAVKRGAMQHGNYTYHNVILGRDGAATVNFENAAYGLPLMDLYFFLRKVMEKNNWKIALGDQILNEYAKECPISKQEWKCLGILLFYPEKYWKIANHYMNSKKSWVADKDVGKLELVCEQELQKSIFLQQVFSLKL